MTGEEADEYNAFLTEYNQYWRTFFDPIGIRIKVSPERYRLETIVLPLAPFRGIVRDYFMICESYYQAIRRSSLAQIEAIDVGRRSLHDEGSTLLMERLADKVVVDHDTARRLFTLICVLHLRG